MKALSMATIWLLLVVLLNVQWCLVAAAQESVGQPSPAGAGVSPDVVQSKAERLAQLEEMLNDPNPLIRISAMDEALKSDDSLMRRLAMKTGLGSSDAEMQAVALREWFNQNPVFDVTFGGTQAFLDEDNRVKQAVASGESVNRTKLEWYRTGLVNLNSMFLVTISELKPNGDISATIKFAGRSAVATGKLTGARTHLTAELYSLERCKLELAEIASESYVGAMSCSRGIDWAGGVLAAVKLY